MGGVDSLERERGGADRKGREKVRGGGGIGRECGQRVLGDKISLGWEE